MVSISLPKVSSVSGCTRRLQCDHQLGLSNQVTSDDAAAAQPCTSCFPTLEVLINPFGFPAFLNGLMVGPEDHIGLFNLNDSDSKLLEEGQVMAQGDPEE